MKFDISDSIDRFYHHLQPEENDRIIFSGKFGAGKTYFLREFFKENDEEYVSIHLFPINYSVASNEDIFELIKFDILFSLLEKGAITEEGEKMPHDIFLYFFLQNKGVDIATALLRFIPKIGAQLGEGTDKVIQLIREYKKEYKKSETKDESLIIEEYLKRIKDEKGNIYEEDLITLLIKDMVESLKGENEDESEDENGKRNKKVVLVIDDLDRIDPGHLFRILNVLSAHTDRYKVGDNKFGFDKIILTFHLENVKNIYHHQYGEETDFKGYIDKFYTEIFEYHLIEGLSNRIGDIVTAIEMENQMGYIFTLHSPHVNTLTYLLTSLVKSRQLTVRNIKNFNLDKYKFKDYEINHPDIQRTSICNFMVLVIIDLLITIFGDIEFLEKVLAKINYINSKHMSINNDVYPLITSSIIIRDIDENKLKLNEKSYTLTLDENEIKFYYRMPKSNLRQVRNSISAILDKVVINGKIYSENEGTLDEENYYFLFKRLLLDTVRIVKDKNLLANRPN